jgi:hypothetical protein
MTKLFWLVYKDEESEYYCTTVIEANDLGEACMLLANESPLQPEVIEYQEIKLTGQNRVITEYRT